ncbi:hypothetical protein ASPVEDRAFT_154582 [Aspergillus versicolor CBS 583.65]|uniref:Rhodopsin domain-containing protein n=1 Tax=Aspergillus versicolor CBS 583.65 TaxID=1036611 RepID=A0A1L9PYG5_ASPVE|nr:uncharacterized protein ASPVEDRAFT_154582 [Aspergillus versicolor CBS 583.65]OJJ06579.1 hypothetical protein ASPVEDRAFT_154582 [Aspergillus versicolor CBS 583.65]
MPNMVVFSIVNNAQRAIIGVAAVFMVLPIVAVTLRIYGRHLKGVGLDLSDYLIMGGLVCSLGFGAIDISCVVNCGVGHHMAEVVAQYGMGPIMLFMKELVAIQIFWAVGNSCVKLSLLSFYCRVFSFPRFIMTAQITAVFILLWALAVILGGFLLCQPFAFTWDQSIPGGHCGNQVLSYQITGALNLVTDLMVLTMPMPYLWKLEMRVSQKIPLMAVFAVGLFVCVATIMRLVSLSLLDFTDLTDNITEAMIWGTIEPALGVTLACIPFMKPIFPFSRSMANYTQSGQTESSHGKMFSRKGFRHPYDPYPLDTMVSTAGAQEPGLQTRPDNASDQERLVSSEQGKGMSIVVQKDFEMK